ncbi:MAG: C25 family cysteine peptidase [Arenicellales bacterium]
MRLKTSGIATGALALAIGLLSVASTSYADDGSNQGPHWGNWQALSRGFVGRRKVPANIDLPVTQRRQSDVTVRSDLVQRLRERFGRKHGGSNWRHRGSSGNGNLSTFSSFGSSVSQSTFGNTGRRFGRRDDPLWLRTTDAGLYAASIADIADAFDEDAGSVRRLAERGRLVMTNAGQPVSWYYDQSSDQILFAGELYNTFYTDQNAYHLEIGPGRDAQPMTVSRGRSPRNAGSATPFRDSIHFEQEPDFNYATWMVPNEPDADYWYWDYLYGDAKPLVQVALDIPNPAPSGQAELRIHMRGWTNMVVGNDHNVHAKLNGTEIGSVSWDDLTAADLVVNVDQSLLDPSGNNTLTLYNVHAPNTYPGESLDSVDVDYTRQPVAKDGMLWLHKVSGGLQVVSGFSNSDILVIESPTGDAVLRSDVRVDSDGAGGYEVTFDAQKGADYLVVERDALDQPFIETDEPSTLSSRNNAADYLIIAPRVFEGTANALAQYRQSRFGYVKIVWLEDIYDEFSYGREDPFAIARFMDVVKNDWRVSPSYVVLIGKGTLDNKDREGYSDSFLPIVMTSTKWALAPSDERLLTGDQAAEWAIGRIPITNDDQGQAYVKKLMAYEGGTLGGERDAVLAADNPDDGGDFHSNSDLLADRLTGSLGFDNVTKLYHPEDKVRAGLIASDTWNTTLVSYDGHGAATQIGDGRENFLKSTDAQVLANTTYPIFTAWTCAAGDFSLPGTPSLVGALVLNGDGGAVASLAPTGLSLDNEAHLLANAFVDGLFGSYDTIGEAARQAKIQTQGLIDSSMPRIYSVIGDPGVSAR